MSILKMQNIPNPDVINHKTQTEILKCLFSF